MRTVRGMLAVAVTGWVGFVAGGACAAEPLKPARLLVVTVTAGFRHGSIGTAEPVLEELGRTSGLYHCDYLRVPEGKPAQPRAPKRKEGTTDEEWQTQEAAFKAEDEKFRAADALWQKVLQEQFALAFAPEALSAFDGVIFCNTTGDLPIPDLAAFFAWLKTGKAFIGMHAATDTLKSDDRYRDLVGGIFAGHPWNGNGEHAFVVHEPGHPLSRMLPERFRWQDEIYQYDTRFDPGTVRVLVSLDMAASFPREPWHVPVSWIRDYGQGRVFYTNFGHNDVTWKTPMFRQHMQEGMTWALKRSEAVATPNPQVQAAEYLRSVVAAAASATGANADEMLAKATAKIARDPGWAVALRPMLLKLREADPAGRSELYTTLRGELDK